MDHIFSEMLSQCNRIFFLLKYFTKPFTSHWFLSFINKYCVVSWQNSKYFSWFSSWALMESKLWIRIFVCCSAQRSALLRDLIPAVIVLAISTGSISREGALTVVQTFRLIWICPLPRHMWNCCIKSVPRRHKIIPGTACSFDPRTAVYCF